MNNLQFWCCANPTSNSGNSSNPVDVVVFSTPENIKYALSQVFSVNEMQDFIRNSFTQSISDIKSQLSTELTESASVVFNDVADRLAQVINAKLSDIPDQTTLVRALLYEKYLEEDLL